MSKQYSENLRKIDCQLFDDISNPKLWITRANESKSEGKNLCSLIAELTSCVIQKDEKAMLNTLEKHKNEPYMQTVAELFSQSPINQQQLWEKIQSGDFCAELRFSLQLYFAQNSTMNKFAEMQLRN